MLKKSADHVHPRVPASRLLVLALCIAVAAGGIAELRRWASERGDARSPVQIEAAAKGEVTLTKVSEDMIPMPAGVPSAHASTLAALPGIEALAGPAGGTPQQ